jgi:hypothetical protein
MKNLLGTLGIMNVLVDNFIYLAENGKGNNNNNNTMGKN